MLNRILTNLTKLPGARRAWTRFPIGPTSLRVKYGAFSRPHYAYGIFCAADLARHLGIDAISVIELGVAGGRGLLAMERISSEVAKALGVQISVYGFDTGVGMPKPIDHRDLPHVWGEGFYRMDQVALRASLKQAHLVLGDISDTAGEFLSRCNRPIGFVSFDLDYYSSTKSALKLFDGPPATRLPRIMCYFDDVAWPERAYHNEYVGELCAINEFNAEHSSRKLSRINMLSWTRPHPQAWNEQTYVLHDFAHPLYCVNVTPKEEKFTQMPI